MEKYKYDDKEFSFLENAELPFAVYQFLDNQVSTILLSKGFLDLFNIKDKESAYYLMDNDMYCECHPDDIAVLQEKAISFAKNDLPYDVFYRSKINGIYHLIHAQGKHIFKGTAKLALISYTDEGKYDKKTSTLSLKLSEEKHIKQYDYLTGLPTIAYFFYLVENSFLKKSAESGLNPVLIFFDLNGMNFYNAKYGFAEGDVLIRSFSRLLVQKFSHESCCRFGMDRFCVFTNDINLEDKLWIIFSEAENINGGKSLPVRAGIYKIPDINEAVSIACDRAKMACDYSKSFYLSHFTYFDNSMLEKLEMRRYIIENIDRAINEKWIKIYYQPIIRSANDCVCDEEALSRWNDPEKGLLAPDQFIPILEDSKLIYKLDLYVTEQILSKMKEQASKGLYIVPISVNLSRSDFDSCDIVEEINNRLLAAKVPPEKLTIEITESIIGSDYEYMKSQIKRFKDLGFKVWMDDFGSGYSSLDILHDIQFDLIKLDMKFMKQFYNNEKTKIILTELIKMSTTLGIESICEGVETEHQVKFLKEIGCTKIQGYYYCQPIPAEKIYERYEKGLQIGFENPEESEYYASLGKINLYDLSVITNNDEEIYGNFFNTLPMSILETDDKGIIIVRGNKSYKIFIEKYFSFLKAEKTINYTNQLTGEKNIFKDIIRQVQKSSKPLLIDEKLSDGTNIHVYIRRIAVNPVTKKTALLTVILGINEFF